MFFFKLGVIHLAMTSIRNAQFCDPALPPPSPSHIRKNEQEIYCLKTIEPANTRQIPRRPLAPFRVDVMNVWPLTANSPYP